MYTAEHERAKLLPDRAALDEALIRWWNAHNSGNVWDSHFRHTLHPFMSWCSARRIGPETVTDRVVSNYVRSKNPKGQRWRRYFKNNLHRQWNVAVSEVPGWPAVSVSAPPYRRELPNERDGQIVTFARHQFHPELVAEVRRFCASGGFLGDDIDLEKNPHRARMKIRLQQLAENTRVRPRPARPLRPLAPDTLHISSRVIFMTATAIHLAGEADISELRSIADVLTAAGAALLTDSLEQRLGPERGRASAVKCLRFFHSIAIRCGVGFTFAEREVLRDLRSDLIGYDNPSPGISERNLRKLMQFDDERKFGMLLALPDVIMGELERARRRNGKVRFVDARLAWLALAIELLNTLPIRRKTLVKIQPGRNLLKPKGGQPKLLVYANQEKSGNLLEARLTDRTWRIIKLYLRHYRPKLIGADRGSYLFPGRRGGHMAPQGVAGAITGLVKEWIGVHVNPHLWRHLMSSKLGEVTGRVEDAERLLGHSLDSRATKRYARLRSKMAAELLRGVTERARAKGGREVKARLLGALGVAYQRDRAVLFRHQLVAERHHAAPPFVPRPALALREYRHGRSPIKSKARARRVDIGARPGFNRAIGGDARRIACAPRCPLSPWTRWAGFMLADTACLVVAPVSA